MKLSEQKAYEMYNDFLDELYPLDGISCNSFSVLLEKGDPTAYNCGFPDFCDAQDIEIED